jgi:hypothetical protein
MQPVPEAETRIARSFSLGDWMLLQTAVIQIISLVGEKRVPGLALINRYVHEGLLDLALLAPDCSTLTLFGKADCERRTIHAAFRPAEGVWVEPREDGQHFVRHSQFARLTSPTDQGRAAAAASTSKLDAWVTEHGPALTEGRPKEGWNKFYDRCRDDCGGWADKKNGKPAAGFGNKTIERRLQHAGYKPKQDR